MDSKSDFAVITSGGSPANRGPKSNDYLDAADGHLESFTHQYERYNIGTVCYAFIF
jgi:hypothetical protein